MLKAIIANFLSQKKLVSWSILILGMQSFSERTLVLSERERERRSKVQEWARARAHPKSAKRERKLALIFCAQNHTIF